MKSRKEAEAEVRSWGFEEVYTWWVFFFFFIFLPSQKFFFLLNFHIQKKLIMNVRLLGPMDPILVRQSVSSFKQSQACLTSHHRYPLICFCSSYVHHQDPNRSNLPNRSPLPPYFFK